jgi:hypothetical protein
MRKSRFVLMFMLLALILNRGPGMVVAQEPPADPATQGHLLVRPEDVAGFGDVAVAEPEGTVGEKEVIDPLPLTGWEEGRSTVLLITSRESGEFVALVYSASYKFPSSQAVQTALGTLPHPINDYSWDWAVLDDVSVFDEDVARLLVGRSWHLWYGTDNEGMLAFFLWFQSGAYVAEVYLNVLQEPLGQRLLNHIIREITERGQVGIPKLWWATNFHNGSGSPSNYSATVWIE